MYFLNLCQQILADMWARKLRSILALFGIIWGTMTVVLLLAIGNGFATASQTSMMSLVDGTFYVTPGATSKSFQGFAKGRPLNIKSSAVMGLPAAIPDVQTVSPMLEQSLPIGIAKKQLKRKLLGVAPSFGYLQKINIGEGRFINNLDINQQNFVAVLGDQVADQLFGDISIIGKKIWINSIPFTIVGKIQKASKNVYNWYKNSVIIPYPTYLDIFGDQNVQMFVVFPNPNADSKQVLYNMRGYFAHKYHYNPADKIALEVFDTTVIFQFMRWFFIGVKIFLGICGALTLGIGSLGVANIMFLIVSERTREIGVRMALGATEGHILSQVILEASIIVALGGLIGFLLAYIITLVLQSVNLPDWLGQPVISPSVVIATILIIAVLGLLAGYFPAKRAAKMDPVEALGH
jgi:putative ABC transport system permease protein